MQAARLKIDFPPAWPIFYMREEDGELDLSEQVSAARAADLKERSHFIKYKNKSVWTEVWGVTNYKPQVTHEVHVNVIHNDIAQLFHSLISSLTHKLSKLRT